MSIMDDIEHKFDLVSLQEDINNTCTKMNEMLEDLINNDSKFLITTFYEENKEHLKNMSESKSCILIGLHKTNFMKHSINFKGRDYHFSFIKENIRITSDYLIQILKTPNIFLFDIY